MSVFSFFGSSKRPETLIRKHAPRVANRRAQAPDRWESIHALAKLGTPKAFDALLVRFTYYVEPSIVDHEEKEAVFQAIVRNRENAFQPVRSFIAKSESISWPLKIFSSWLTSTEIVTELIDLLQPLSIEYERDPQRKIQILAALRDLADDRVAEAVLPFLADVNETARFHAVETVLSQPGGETLLPRIFRAMADEESSRIRSLVFGIAAEKKWNVKAHMDNTTKISSAGFKLLPDGTVVKS